MARTEELIREVDQYSARNYNPLPVVIERGEGVWVFDVEGRKYLDMLSAYSALNQGHRHPKIIRALVEQAEKITLTSRAFHNETMGPFLHKLCAVTGYEKALPMNTGAEAVETALKAARKWGLVKKGVPENQGEIIVCENNAHRDHCELLQRGAVSLWIRPLYAGFCDRTLWRCRGAGSSYYTQHRGHSG